MLAAMRLFPFALAATAVVPTTVCADEASTAATSYRSTTIGIDAAGLAMMATGSQLMRRTDARDAGDALMSGGLLVSALAVPIVHGVRGHRDRVLGSLLLRGSLFTTGLFVSLIATAGCDGLLCELEYLDYGVIAGFTVAAIADAAFLTTETAEPARSTVAPTFAAGRDGTRVGIAWTW